MAKRYVVCVDDEVIITESLKRELRNELPHLYIEAAYSGERALALLDSLHSEGNQVAVLVSDERMPGMQGHELLKEAHQRYPGMYGILLTGFTDLGAVKNAINEASLFRYLSKPWERRDMVMAVARAAELFERERELEALRDEVRQLNTALISALESCCGKSPVSICHVRRVARYAALLGRLLGLPETEVSKLFLYAPLHDIGKSGIPASIIGKPGALTENEFQVVKKHVQIGTELLDPVGIDPLALDLIQYHHEHWDGTGYLSGASGDAIPLAARITALADALDAMMTSRVYKEAMSFDEAAGQILAGSGSRFDPAIVEVFAANLDDFRRISAEQHENCCAGFNPVLH